MILHLLMEQARLLQAVPIFNKISFDSTSESERATYFVYEPAFARGGETARL